MGITCSCGHKEIAVLRPCGHTMCANPCFEKYILHNKIMLEDDFKVKDGFLCYFENQKKIDMDVVSLLKCPKC